MSRHDILWNLSLAEGQEYEAAWWMYHREEVYPGQGVVIRGVKVNRARKVKGKDLIG